MENRFFYGTLAHLPLLEIVLGRRIDAKFATAASLENHAVYWVQGQAYPVIMVCPDACASGLMIAGLTTQDVARLDFYEGGFSCELRRVQIKTANGTLKADMCFPSEIQTLGALWKLSDWVDEWAELAEQSALEAMRYFGRIEAAELAKRFPAIRRRAASYIRAKTTRDKPRWASDLSRADVTVKTTDMPYSNFFAMQEFDIRFRKFSGEMSAALDRAAFVGFDVAIVLPYDPVRDCVLLVEQFRLGPYARGARYPWVLEPIAGHIDVGETPIQAARRETIEEAGLELTDLVAIAQTYPSPGCSTEYYHIYLGLCDLPPDSAGCAGGLASENEDIKSHILSYDQLMQFVDSGAANVQPLVLAAHWLARNREQLRRDA